MSREISKADLFKELTWDDLQDWAGSRVLSRGQGYQRSHRVKGLAQTQTGSLVAWVQGGQRYATEVDYTGGGQYLKNVLVASAELEPSQVQDLGEIMPDLLKIKAKANTPLRFHVDIEVGDGKTPPSKEAANAFNKVLKKVKEDFQLR
jgi:hypothetical protein